MVSMWLLSYHVIDEEAEAEKQKIIDMTETNLIGLRRTIYLTLQSSLDFEEAAHKLLKLQVKPGQEGELCNMVLDCGAQQRTYEKFYGLLAQVNNRMSNEWIRICLDQAIKHGGGIGIQGYRISQRSWGIWVHTKKLSSLSITIPMRIQLLIVFYFLLTMFIASTIDYILYAYGIELL